VDVCYVVAPASRGKPLAGKGTAMTVAPQIFHRRRSAPNTPYEQYRWDGEHVICERVTPNATVSGVPYKEFLQQWTGEAFLIDNVGTSAKNDFSRIWKEIHASRNLKSSPGGGVRPRA
jgi:hypothetical protein